jgi:hypothetical protein
MIGMRVVCDSQRILPARSARMLAYVFWHGPSPEADRASYERSLAAFHRILSETKPPGFRRSMVFRARGLPWLRTEGPGYEDWYFVDGSASLDPLNDAAVSGARKGPHDQVVRLAQEGAGGGRRPRFASWLTKPRGTSYEALDARRPMTERAAALWPSGSRNGRQCTRPSSVTSPRSPSARV